MAQNYSPRIVQDSLVMCLDASQNKSYPTIDLPLKHGLVMWMDADDATTFSYSSGTTVSQWRDKSGYNYHMVPVSAGPTRNSSLNSRKTLLVTSAQQIGNLSINLQTSANTVFVVSRLTGGANGRVLTAYYNNWLLGHWGGYVNEYYAEGWIAYAVNAADTTWRIYMGDWGGSSNDTANAFSNGTSIRNASAGDASAGPKGLGINYQGYEQSNAEVAEIIVFNRLLSDTERKLVHTYLGQKWGILNVDRNIFDLSGFEDNGFLGDGTTANMPFLDYYNKGSLKFDGSNDYLSVTRTLSVPFTISGFIKYVDQSKVLNTFINGYPHQTIAISLNRNGAGNLQVFLGNGSSWVGAPAISYSSLTVDTWYHITFTCDGTTSRLYLNGVSIGTSSIIPSGFGSYFYLGHLTGAVSSLEYLKGNIAAAQLYTTALSADQVLQNYESQKSKFAVSLVQQGLILNLDAGNPYSYAGAGTTWYDTSLNNYTGTLTNGPVYSNTNGGIIVFDGSNDFVDLTGITLSISGNAARSIFTWVKTTYTGLQGFISTGTPANSQAFNLVKYGSYVGVMGYNNDFYPSSGKYIADGVWHYVGATFDGTNIRTYVDGVLDNTSGTFTYSTTGQNNYVGRSNHTGNENFINGSMGNAQIYNRALSAAEVLQNYNATKGRFGL